MLSPTLPDYDIAEWRGLPFSERLRWTCRSWALQGYGTPLAIFVLYGLKIGLYIGGWAFFCSFTADVEWARPETWWATPTSFLKAILWTLLFEGLGLGCGSGPLTARYAPPIGGPLYFLRPGTVKLPFCEGWPVIGGDRRTLLDVCLYALVIGLLVVTLVSASVSLYLVMAIGLLIVAIGASDRTVFLSFRPEHYLSVLVCCFFAGDWSAGAKWVWLAIWWWAATSKLNRHFPVVMCVMVSNAPWTRFVPGLRRAMYRAYPDDLRHSRFASAFAHAGTALEYLFPIALIFGSGPVLWGALIVMTVFHLFILSNVPMGVPLEWNVIMIYGGFVLFGVNADVAMWSVSNPGLIIWLLCFHLLLPLYGNLRPDKVSFLLAMRYYAGNWAYSIWLFRDGCEERLDAHIPKTSQLVPKQLSRMYDEDTVTALMSKVVAFRMMHLHGRAMMSLLPKAVEDVEAVTWYDGEVVAGMVLGWNFGDGHLHDERLLAAVQRRCGFEPGDLRCVMVESQPMGAGTLSWRICDAATGQVAAGQLPVKPMLQTQAWEWVEDGA